MTSGPHVDAALVQWGDRLFYPANRMVRSSTPRLGSTQRRAELIRARIASVVRRAPQVMVKVTGGGRGMAAIAAHFRYISKAGRLDIEDDRGEVRSGKDAVRDLVEQWRYAGSLIEEESSRREAFNIMLSMPAGTDSGILQKAVREFAQQELAGHRYVMVLHEHQANPHMHLSVRAESVDGKRLNPRKADLHRWRETFAEKLRGWGLEAEATRQATRGESRNYEPLWRLKARQEGRLRGGQAAAKTGKPAQRSRAEAMVSWAHILKALANSHHERDRKLAQQVDAFVRGMPLVRDRVSTERLAGQQGGNQTPQQTLPGLRSRRGDIGPSR